MDEGNEKDEEAIPLGKKVYYPMADDSSTQNVGGWADGFGS